MCIRLCRLAVLALALLLLPVLSVHAAPAPRRLTALVLDQQKRFAIDKRVEADLRANGVRLYSFGFQ